MVAIMPVKAAGFIVFRHSNALIEYLLLQASYGVSHWSPPKGHVDPGESDLVTAWREVKEETGLSKTDLSLIPDFERNLTYQVKNEEKTVVYWLAELKKFDEEVKISSEHTTYKWATLEEAINFVEHLDLIQLFKEAQEFLMKTKFGS